MSEKQFNFPLIFNLGFLNSMLVQLKIDCCCSIEKNIESSVVMGKRQNKRYLFFFF